MSLTHEILGGEGGVLFVLRQSDFVVQANLKLTAVLLPEKSWDHIPMSVCLANTYVSEVYFLARPKQYLLIAFNKLVDNSCEATSNSQIHKPERITPTLLE